MVICLKENFAGLCLSWQRCHWKDSSGAKCNFYVDILIFPYAQHVLWHISLSCHCASGFLTDLLLLTFCLLGKGLNAFVSWSTVGLNLLDSEKHLLPNATWVGSMRPSSQPDLKSQLIQNMPHRTMGFSKLGLEHHCVCFNTTALVPLLSKHISILEPCLCAPSTLLQRTMGILAHDQCFSHEKC